MSETMFQRRQRLWATRQFRCERCGAGEYDDCMTPRGRWTSPHRERVAARDASLEKARVLMERWKGGLG